MTVGLMVSVLVVAPEIEPPLDSGVPFLRHLYVRVGWPVAVTLKTADAPEQRVRLPGAVTVIGMRS